MKNLTIETLSTKGLFIAFKVNIFNINCLDRGPTRTEDDRDDRKVNLDLYRFSRGKTANWYRAKKYRMETERLEWLTLTRY